LNRLKPKSENITMDTYKEAVTATETNHEFTPIADLLEKEIAAPSAEPEGQAQDSVGPETVEPNTQVAETVESGGEGKNDCLADTAEIVLQVHEFHVKAEKSDTDTLVYNWEAGTRINTLKKSVGHGSWESFLADNFPDISLTTVWRYRQIAKSFSLKDLTGMTLSQAYAKLKLAKFQDETFTEGDDGDNDPSSGKKNQSKLEKLISTVAKASKHFDLPTSLSQGQKSAVKKLCAKLEDVHGQVTMPSILGLEWQTKIEKAVSDWTKDDVTIFTQDFAKLLKAQKDLELLEGEPGDIPQEEATPLADAPPPVVPEPELVVS
jgi:hypothetical protein